MKQQYKRPVPGLKTSLQDVHPETVDVIYKAGTYSLRKSGFAVSNILVFTSPIQFSNPVWTENDGPNSAALTAVSPGDQVVPRVCGTG